MLLVLALAFLGAFAVRWQLVMILGHLYVHVAGLEPRYYVVASSAQDSNSEAE